VQAYLAELPPYALLPAMPTGASWGRVFGTDRRHQFIDQVSTPPIRREECKVATSPGFCHLQHQNGIKYIQEIDQ